MIALPMEQALAAMNGRAVGELPSKVCAVFTDTRSGVDAGVFVALRGPSHDGHNYVDAARAVGAQAAVVDHTVDSALPQIVVDDTLAALGRLARATRRLASIPVIAVTGSVGKTSTRHMVAHVLAGSGPVLSNEANHNNEVGVPQTLLRLEAVHTAAVIEMGMRARGEIAHLSRIVEPTHGVITNIGYSHLELLGSREAIAEAKAEMLAGMPDLGAAALPADDAFLPVLRDRCRCRVVTFGTSPAADYRVSDIRLSDAGCASFAVNGQHVALPVPGLHHSLNAAAAVAVCAMCGIDLRDALDRLRTFPAPSMRMEELHTRSGALLINDAYNAAPDSMVAALETLAALHRQTDRPIVAVLGDMRELGRQEEALHREIGARPEMAALRLLVTVGDKGRWIGLEAASRCTGITVAHFETAEAVIEAIPNLVHPSDIVLVKGSRALALDRIATILAA